jgi:serine/threonine-protein kinase
MHFATPTTPPSAVLDLGDRRVRLDACLGQGSVASVYRAVLESAFGVRKPVACKIFGVVASEEEDHVLDALGNAVRRASCVRHPNVVDVFEMGLATLDRAPFILSELVQGATLRQLLDAMTRRRGRMPLDLALFVGIEVAEALSGARTAKGPEGLQLGVAHLDLGARDVLLSWHGEVKVKDFEIGCERQGASSVRSLSSLARRADTMAPEVAHGGEGDARSDVFSLGIILREMLIGPRFVRGTGDAEALKLAREGFVQPITFEPHLPEEVRRVLNRALELEPERRYPHAGSMAYDLRRVALGLGVGDARVFLKAHLQKELAEERSDATLPHEIEKKPRRRRRE